ncbi:MAG: hypothetical protein IPN47_25330 [Gemmatimonadetes bacterium]|nr:hypothetical protein [Gemmatimonadota bacterium]MBK9411301.1 hypothetical protein [Gemmatimonadota bacterium]MBK9977089.1 hypothetical protein [Gemmatimonadota bacterium]
MGTGGGRTGMVEHGFTGGIGTASRTPPGASRVACRYRPTTAPVRR